MNILYFFIAKKSVVLRKKLTALNAVGIVIVQLYMHISCNLQLSMIYSIRAVVFL